MTDARASDTDRQAGPTRHENATPYILCGLAIVTLLIGGLFTWSVTATIDGAVIAPGTVVVESSRKAVQHVEGGVIGEIFVREGDAVEAGQLLIRLDDRIERANLAVIVDQLHELMARRARLRAEVDGDQALEYEDALLDLRTASKVRAVLDGQLELFAARKAARDGQRRILQQRIASFRDQIAGLKDQRAARSRQIRLIREELAGVEQLNKKGLAPVTRVLELKRQLTRIEAESAEHTTDIARATNSISEVQLQMIQVERTFKEEAARELRDVHARVQGLVERRVAAETRLARIDIAAPQSGTVLALKAHTIGGVIRAGETIMEIVPGDDDLILQAQVQPRDVNKVKPGQTARIRLTAFDPQTTPEVFGTLLAMSADRLEDSRRDTPYFVARIRIEDGELARLGDVELLPGMPAEVFIRTGEKVAIGYLLKPLLDTFARAFKDGSADTSGPGR